MHKIVTAGGIPATTDECLLQLARYGRPHLMQSRNGTWHCSVDMNVNATGVKFEASVNQEESPLAAAQGCYRTMMQAIHTVNKIGSES